MEFVVLYTHQKIKKSKVWQDGFLTVIGPNKAALFDDNKSNIDTLRIKSEKVIVGANLESCKYLIQVEECKSKADTSTPAGTADGSPAEEAKKGPAFVQNQTRAVTVRPAPSDSISATSASLSKSVTRVGLKRRHTGFVHPRQIKAKKNDEYLPTKFQENSPSDHNNTIRQDTSLWSSPGYNTSRGSNRYVDYRITSHDTSYMMPDRSVTDDTSNSWTRQNNSVEVDMQGSRTGTELQNQNGRSFYKQTALNCQTDIRNQHGLTPELNLKNHLDGSSSWYRSNEKGETDLRQFRAKRSCSQILALIGNGLETEKMSEKAVTATAADHVQMCANGDITSKSVCEFYSTEGPEKTIIPRPSEAVEDLMEKVEGVIEEGVDHFGETKKRHVDATAEINNDNDRTRYIAGEVSPVATSSVEGVEHSVETEDQHVDAATKSNSDTARDIIGMVSPVARSTDADVDLPVAETNGDSEQVCFDICFSPLSDWESVDAASDQPSGDECAQDNHMHIVSDHCSDIKQNKLSVNADKSQHEGTGLVTNSGMTESADECSQSSDMHTVSQQSSHLKQNKVSVNLDKSQREGTHLVSHSGMTEIGGECSQDSHMHTVTQHSGDLKYIEVSVGLDVSQIGGTHFVSQNGVTKSGDECLQRSHTHTVSKHSSDLKQNKLSVNSNKSQREATGLVPQSGVSCSHLDESDCSDIPDDMAGASRAIGDTRSEEINELVIDCHSLDVSSGHNVVNCHTPEGGNVICSGSDIVNRDSEIVKCLSPDSNTLSLLINKNKNCIIATDVDVICHMDDANTDNCHVDYANTDNCHIDDPNADSCHTDNTSTDNYHVDDSNTDNYCIDDTNGDNSHTDDTTSNTVNCHTADSDQKSGNQSIGNGDVVNCRAKCHDDATVKCCESGNIVTCLLPNIDTISCHRDSDVNNDSQSVDRSLHTCDHVDHKNNFVDAGDSDCSNVDNMDGDIDGDSIEYLHNNKNSVDSQRAVIERGNTYDNQTDKIRDSEGCYTIDTDGDSFSIDDGDIFVDRENENQSIGDKNTRDCFIATRFTEDITDDRECCVTDRYNKDGHFGDSCKRHKSGSDKVCDTGEKKNSSDTIHHNDCHVEGDDIGDNDYHNDCQVKMYVSDNTDHNDGHFEGETVGDTNCHNDDPLDSNSRHHSNDTDKESCHSNDENEGSCFSDNGFDTDSNVLRRDSAADKTAPLECGIKIHDDKVHFCTPDDTCPGDYENDKIWKESPMSEAIPEQTITEGDAPPELDTEGTVCVLQHTEEGGTSTVVNDRCGDTDSMDTTDTMYSSSQDSPRGNSPQQAWQEPPQQRQVESDWAQHQRRICLPPSMSRRVDLRAAAVRPADGVLGITPQLGVCCKRQKVESGNVITRERLNRDLHLTLTPSVQLASPWGACSPALVATPPQLPEVGRNSKEDIAISVSSRLVDYTLRGTRRSATVRRDVTPLNTPLPTAGERQTAVTSQSRLLTSDIVPHSPELLSWQLEGDKSLYYFSPDSTHQKETPFDHKQLFLLSQKPDPIQQVNHLGSRQLPLMSEIQRVPDANPPSPLVISPHKVPSTDQLSPAIFFQDIGSGSPEHRMSFKPPDYIYGDRDSTSVVCPDNNFGVLGYPGIKRKRRPLKCRPFEDSMTCDTLTGGSSIQTFTIDDDLDDIEVLVRQQDDDKNDEGRNSNVDRGISNWVTMGQTYDSVMSPNEATNDDMLGLLPWAQRNDDTSGVSQYQLLCDSNLSMSSSCHQYHSDTSYVTAQDQITGDVTQTVSHCSSPCEQFSHLSPGLSRDSVSPRTLENDNNNTRWGKFVDTESKPNTTVNLYHSRFTPRRQVGDGHSREPTVISPLVLSKPSSDDMKDYEDQLEQGTKLRCDNIVCDRSPLLQPAENKNQCMRRTGARAGFKPPAVVRQEPGRRVNHRGKAALESSSFVRMAMTASVCQTSELRFPSPTEAEGDRTSCRLVTIPAIFPTVVLYKQVLTAALNEHLNLQLLEVARQFYRVCAMVDTTSYSPLHTQPRGVAKSANSKNPVCEHGAPSKIVQVKKEGRNKGRYFYTCNNSQATRCCFFKWLDEGRGTKMGTYQRRLQLSDGRSIETHFKQRHVALYCECQLILKSPRETYKSHLKNFPRWMKQHLHLEDSNCKKTLYIKLENKLNSSAYARDDLWVISQELTFEPGCTFLARSSFHGPSTLNEVEIEAVSGYSPSNWPNGVLCHAIHAGNFSSELTCLANLETFVNPSTLPLLPQLLSRDGEDTSRSCQGGFIAPACKVKQHFHVPDDVIEGEALSYIEKYQLNEDQATSLLNVALMFSVESLAPSVTLVHGVFGSGKSYLLAVVVMFLTRLFELNEAYTSDAPTKLLISSTTNVAVDRILLSLLDLGFDDFVRVGSVKKIAKPILPLSVHASGSQNQELKDLQDMLKSDITAEEKVHVRRSIEQLRKGANKQRLGCAHVVGATCAACVFSCMKDFTFQVVLLDECSQMTEPTSLLPIARFHCSKLVLVGDPKQLSPTIQGSEAAHNQGLEQTLFDRLLLMGHQATMLHTQYRCHPDISAIANQLFYECQLNDGVTVHDRPALAIDWPTVCFFDVANGNEQSQHDSSFYNVAEAKFVVCLIDVLVHHHDIDPTDIGVITLYRAQVAAILQRLQAARGAKDRHEPGVQVSTVDAFQGGERPVIILSCVLTHSQSFLDSDKRTNVALTRAKNHLFIVGHYGNLTKNKLWCRVIQYCQGRPGGMCNSREMLKRWNETMTD